jgi:hypothetical protein
LIRAIAGLLGGAGALPWAIGLVLLGFAGMTAAWSIEAAKRDAAELRATAAAEKLATAEAALADRAAVIAALDRQAQATRDLRAELEPTRRIVHAAPRTTACVASPVIRAGADSMRAARAAAAAPRPGPDAGPAGLPRTPAGAEPGAGR